MEYSNNTKLSRWTKSTGTSQTNVMANKTTPDTYSSTHARSYAHTLEMLETREEEDERKKAIDFTRIAPECCYSSDNHKNDI